MQVLIEESFRNDILKTRNKTHYGKVAQFIEVCQAADKLSDIANVKKLKGFKNYFRMKVGDYRLGFEYTNNEIIFHRFLHRKDIYRFFP